VYYDDGTSSQWVAISGAIGPTGETGPPGPAGPPGPTGPEPDLNVEYFAYRSSTTQQAIPNGSEFTSYTVDIPQREIFTEAIYLPHANAAFVIENDSDETVSGSFAISVYFNPTPSDPSAEYLLNTYTESFTVPPQSADAVIFGNHNFLPVTAGVGLNDPARFRFAVTGSSSRPFQTALYIVYDTFRIEQIG
jgi:hypothetical protein